MRRKCDVILPKMAEPVIDRFAMAQNVYIYMYVCTYIISMIYTQMATNKHGHQFEFMSVENNV